MDETSRAQALLDLTLYTRRDCPLCDEMRAALERWDAGRRRYRLKLVDIDRNRDLKRRFGRRVPVLARGEDELCAGRLDAAALDALLEPSEARCS